MKMLNRHEVFMLFVIQFATIFTVQNVYPIFSTYGRQLSDDHAYIKEARDMPTTNFYRFSKVDEFYSTYAQMVSDKVNVKQPIIQYLVTIQQCGLLIGSMFFGYISDHFGRRRVCQYVLLFSTVVLLVEGFLSSPIFIAVCRFVIGTQAGGLMIVTWSLATELISTKTRFLARAFANWPNAKVVLVFICYLSKNWRISLHVCAGFTLFAAMLYTFFVPESPTWLHCHGKKEKSQKICDDVFEKSSGHCIITLPTGYRTKTLTLTEIWGKEKYRNIIILFGAIWVMTNFTTIMLDFSEVIIFKNSLMYSQMLLTIVPAVAKMLLGLVEVYLGIISRRNLHLVSLFINGVAMGSCGLFIVFDLHKTNQTLYVITFLLGYSSIEFIWDACYLCVVEQVPTEVRGTISGACAFLARFAGVVASKMDIIKQLYEPAPLFIAFATALIHFIIAYIYLDESKDVNLGEVGFDLRRISGKVSQKIRRLTARKKSNVEPQIVNK